jgi:hypothetical protein
VSKSTTILIAVASAGFALVALHRLTFDQSNRSERQQNELTLAQDGLRKELQNLPDTYADANLAESRESQFQSRTGIADLERELAAASPGSRDLVLDATLAKIAEKAPTESARFAELLEDPRLREQALRVVSQSWGARKPMNAMAWAASLGNAEERDSAIVNICIGLSTQDPAAAVKLWTDQQWAAASGPVLDGLVQQWAEADFEAAVAWFTSGPVDSTSSGLLERIVFAKSQADPAEAARLVETLITDSDRRLDAIAMITQQWAMQDPQAARAWINEIHDGRLRARAFAELNALPPPTS